MASTPHALERVCGPKIDDVGRFGDSFAAASDSGRLNAIVIGCSQKQCYKLNEFILHT